MTTIPILDLPIDETEFSVLDFETTGTSPQFNRVIEVGVVKIKKGKIVDHFSSLINPGTDIPYFITNLTGISNADVANAPYFDEIAGKLFDYLGDSIFVAHNAQFDYRFLQSEFNRAGIDDFNNPSVCTLKLSRLILKDLKSKALGNVARHLRVIQKDVHRALGDATATAKILLKFIPRLKEEENILTAKELIEFQSKPKTKGYLILKKKLADDFASVPKYSGVYFFKNRKDEIIYVGKAKVLKDRLRNYFSSNAVSKSKKIVRRANSLQFRKTNSELTALLLETRLIKKFNPEFNVQLKKFPPSYFIKISTDTEFPDIATTSKFDFDGNNYFGPYNTRETCKKLHDIIDGTFQMRECNKKEFAKGKVCYLYDIKRCLAPCIYKDIQKEYSNEIDHVVEFLSGHNQFAVDRLLNTMKKYSEAKRYEEAAKVRDTANLMLEQFNRSAIINGPINKAKVVIIINDGIKKDYLFLYEGKIIIRNSPFEDEPDFDDSLNDYFSGTVNIFHDLTEQDHENLKITLSWLVRNRLKANLFYLDNFESKDELFAAMSLKVN